ncbi:MAG TPA: SGNH/GDSL hydrolase family protein, partial [Bauldia sp.]|nr:SGNH/GDSL hydrolase family protein [Bauldia sp.]
MAKTTKRAAKPAKAERPPAGRIDLETLHRKLADPRTSEASLRKYFKIDETRSGPFTPQLELNPATVKIPPTPDGAARGDMAIASANWWCRMRRTSLFNARMAEGYKGPIIVSEGDSWFQYPILLNDVIDHLIAKGYAIRSLDAAGDTLENMIRSGEYLDGLRQTGASVFLFSAGGNDVLGGGNLASVVRDFDPALNPAQHILPAFQTLLDQAIAGYDQILRNVEALPGDILTICHGYDKPLPNKGKWLGLPLEKRGIKDREFQRQIVGVMIDRFNAALARLAGGFANVRCLDLRGVVGPKPKRWHDELHPTDRAYGAVADRFDATIRAAHPRAFAAKPAPGVRPSLAVKGEERPVAPRGVKKPAVAKKRRGLSLHVGLNEIDPGHYGS